MGIRAGTFFFFFLLWLLGFSLSSRLSFPMVAPSPVIIHLTCGPRFERLSCNSYNLWSGRRSLHHTQVQLFSLLVGFSVWWCASILCFVICITWSQLRGRHFLFLSLPKLFSLGHLVILLTSLLEGLLWPGLPAGVVDTQSVSLGHIKHLIVQNTLRSLWCDLVQRNANWWFNWFLFFVSGKLCTILQ